MQFVHVYILNFHSETGAGVGSVGIQNVHLPPKLNKSSLDGRSDCFKKLFYSGLHKKSTPKRSLVDVEKKYIQ